MVILLVTLSVARQPMLVDAFEYLCKEREASSAMTMSS